MEAEIFLNKFKCVIATVYKPPERPPDSSKEVFLNKMIEFLEILSNKANIFMICDDFYSGYEK